MTNTEQLQAKVDELEGRIKIFEESIEVIWKQFYRLCESGSENKPSYVWAIKTARQQINPKKLEELDKWRPN